MNQIEIRGVPFDNVTMAEAVETVLGFAKTDGCKLVITPNSEIVQLCIEDASIMQTVRQGNLIIPDGIGVIYAAKILGTPLKEKVAGYELACNLLPRMEQQGLKLFLFGSAPGIALEAKKKMQQQYPNLNICGTHNGYFKEDEPIIEAINESGADVVFVCLGAPKQEKWMAANRERIQAKVMLGLGGSLDVFAGNVKRAPDVFVKCGMEWFYRLAKEPWRYKRMAKLPKFLFGTIKEKHMDGGKKK